MCLNNYISLQVCPSQTYISMIRCFGVSNVCGWQLQKIVDRTKSMCLNSYISMQVSPSQKHK